MDRGYAGKWARQYWKSRAAQPDILHIGSRYQTSFIQRKAAQSASAGSYLVIVPSGLSRKGHASSHDGVAVGWV